MEFVEPKKENTMQTQGKPYSGVIANFRYGCFMYTTTLNYHIGFFNCENLNTRYARFVSGKPCTDCLGTAPTS